MKKLHYLIFLGFSLLSCVKREIVNPEFDKITGLSYSTDTLQMREGESRKSTLPTFKGSEQVGFQICSIPFTDQIGIDDKGVIKAEKGLKAGKYIVSVKAINPAGAVEFKNILTIHVDPIAQTPSNFFYTPNSVSVTINTPYTSPKPNIDVVGAVEFSYVNESTGIPVEGISIHSETGEISANRVSVGEYKLVVTAANAQGKRTTPFTIKVNQLALPKFSYKNLESSFAINISRPTNGLLGILPVTLEDSSSPLKFYFDVKIDGKPVLNPYGLFMNENTGLLIINDQSITGIYILDIYATNAVGTTKVSYTFCLQDNYVNTELYNPGDIQIKAGEWIFPTLPTDRLFTFDLQDEITGKPIDGLTIDPVSGVIKSSLSMKKDTYQIIISVGNKLVWFGKDGYVAGSSVYYALRKKLTIL